MRWSRCCHNCGGWQSEQNPTDRPAVLYRYLHFVCRDVYAGVVMIAHQKLIRDAGWHAQPIRRPGWSGLRRGRCGSQRTSRIDAFRGALAQALGLEGFDVLKAVQDTPLQLQEYRADTFGAPAFKRCFADSPTFGQLALFQMFDTHDALLLVVANS